MPSDHLLFRCPACGKELMARAHLEGKKVQCPGCGAAVPVVHGGGAAGFSAWRGFVPPAWLVLALILAATFLLKLRNLDHTGLTRWDEVFHAIVAQNVMKHPLKPTLVDVPYLPYDHTKWGENHVWLHKPILPFWQVALSFALLGVNTFALRLPSAILSTAAAWLTFRIGEELLDRGSALFAASIQAASPFLLNLVHGYQFADFIDVALLFWVELAMLFLIRSLRTGSWRYLLLAGVAQGLAFLCKSYLAAIVFGVALAAWVLPLCRLARRGDLRIGPRHLLAILGATVLVAAPWTLYCMFHYPDEFWHEHDQVWRHLYTNVETWHAPWDRLVFDYLIAIHGVFYTPILVAVVVLLGRALLQRHAGLWLLYAWGAGVILPHLFAVTKTPSATTLAIPPLLLLLGRLVTGAWKGERWPLVALTAVLAFSLAMPAVVNRPGHGFPSPRVAGGVMREATWVIWHVAGAVAIVIALGVAWVLLGRRLAQCVGYLGRWVHIAALLFCVPALGWLGYRTVTAAWRVTLPATHPNSRDPVSVEVGEYARRNLPENAVLFCEQWRGYEHLTIMFYADRTCYPLKRLDEAARAVRDAGGTPYIVSYRKLGDVPVFTSKHGVHVVLWSDAVK